ncbi:hypothetical protein SUGI_0757870 [Cryptomeria japonica]|nr:hypothetical protein SUGI_0757870 [Cryptomeria japonica]
MMRDGAGFVCLNGVWLHVSEFRPPLRPYLLCSANCNKEVRRASAQIGMHGVKEYLAAWEQREIKRELEKWGPNELKLSSLGGASSSRRKRGSPRGSKKKRQRRTLWIGFSLEDNDDIDELEEPLDRGQDANVNGKEIVITE